MFMDVINTSISHHFPTASRSIRPGLPFVMVIADTGVVGGLFGSIFDQNRWCITTFATIAAIVWATNNVIQHQTGHAAEDSDSESDEEEEDAVNDDGLAEEDELVAMEEAAPKDVPKPRRKFSIAHDDMIRGRIVYFDTDLEDINP